MKLTISKFAFRTLITISLCLILLTGLLASGLFKASGSGTPEQKVTVQAAGRGTPSLNLRDGREMQVQYRGDSRLSAALAGGGALARSLASADLDDDGAPDVLAGYANNGSGLLTVQRGNTDAYAPKDETVFQRMQEGYNPDSLATTAEVYETPEAVDFLASGDFNQDGQKDVLVAARGGGLYLLAAEGGKFAKPEQIGLTGTVTAMTTGQFRAADGFTDVAVAVNGASGPELLIFDGRNGLTGAPIRFSLAAPATAVEFGEMDSDPFMDVAVATTRDIEIIHGWGRNYNLDPQSRVERLDLGFNARGLANGLFLWNRSATKQLAALGDDGTVRILQHGNADTRPFSEAEIAERAKSRLHQSRDNTDVESVVGWQAKDAEPWSKVREFFAGTVGAADTTSQRLLMRSHVALRETDDLLVMGSEPTLKIVQQVQSGDPASAQSIAGTSDLAVSTLDMTEAPASVLELPQKLNGERNLLVLQTQSPSPSVVAISPTATITVDRTDDPSGASLTAASACTAAANDCSLRGAVQFANSNPGTTISIPAGTYTLSINGAGGCTMEPTATGNTVGDLEVNASTTFTGAGSATTIIRQTGVGGGGFTGDRVICLNTPVAPTLNYSFSGLTITGGRESSGIGGAGMVGGAKDNTLSLTDVTISNNQDTATANYSGGGLSMTGGSVTITNSLIGGTNPPGANRSDVTLGNSAGTSGGGVGYSPGDPFNAQPSNGTFTMTGSTVRNNTAASTAAGGGGADLYTHNSGTGSFSISGNSVFQSNSATAGNGGGIIIESLGLTLNSTTFTSNTAPASGHLGGAIYLSGGSLTFNSSTSFSSNTSNNTAANAIGVNSGGAGGGVTVTGTGNNINDNVDILGNGDWTNATGSAVTFATLTLEACPGCPTPRGNFTANNSTTNATNVNMAGGTFNGNTGTLNVSNNLNLTGTGATFNASSGSTTITGNYTQSAGTFNGSSGTVNLAGNFAFSGGTFTASTNTFNFNGSGAQSIGSSTVTFNNLTVNKTGGSTLTLNNNINVAGNLNVSAGVFDLQSFTANRTVAGGTLTVANGATLKVGGTNSLPTNYSTHSIGATSTIEYSGTNQAIAVPNSSQSYGNLTTSGSGTKTLAGTITVATNLTIGSGTVLAGGTNTLNIQGNWTNNAGTGGFTSTGAGTVNFNGSGAQALNGATTFNILTINKTGGTLTLGANISTAGNFNLTAGTFDASSFTVNVGGNWNNTGTFTPSTSTVNFNGSGAQSINNATTFNNLSVNKSGGTLTLAANATVNGDLTVSAGTFDLGSFTANRATTGGTMTVSNGATVNIGGTNSLPANYSTYSFGPSSTINFNGSTQSVPGATYGNLTISTAGTKTLTGDATIAGNLLISAGTFDAGANTINIGGNWTLNTGAAFTPGTSTVNFNSTTAAQAINGTATSQTFNNLSVNNSGQTLSIGGSTATLNVGGTLLVNAGTFAQSACALNISGNLTVSNGAFFTKASGGQALTFNGTNQTWTDSNTTSQDFGNVIIGGTNNTVTAGGNLKATALTINTGNVFFLNGKNFAFTSATGITNNGTLRLIGNENFTNVNSPGLTSGLVEYVGDGTAGPFTLRDFGSNDYFNLSINDTHATKATFSAASSINISNNLTLASGTLSDGTGTISLSGLFNNTGGTYAPGTGTFAFIGSNNTQTIPASTSFNNLTINHSGSGGVVLGGDATVGGTLTLTSGTLTIGANTLTLNGAISTGSGSLVGGNTSNLVVGGTGASTTLPAITNDLNNLTLNRANGLQLGSNLTVNGTLTLTSGDLNTGSFTLTQPASAPASQGSGDVVGNVKRTSSPSALPTGTAMTFGNPNNSITFSATGTTPTDITVNLVKAAPSGSMAFPNAVQRTYTITPNGGSGYAATLRLHYLDSELGPNTEGPNLSLWRFNGTGWAPRPSTNFDTTNNWVETTTTQFSAWTLNSTNPPTAAPGTISGRVTDTDGTPLGGVVMNLNGLTPSRTITDANGNYKFENVEVNNFYTVSPERANYSFNPSNRSFSLTADKTDAVFTATANATQTGNPLETDLFFVRQQYLDFLGREPDAGGLAYWASELAKCGTDAACLNSRRIGVSAAFFIESEHQRTGSFVYRLYKGGLGRQANYAEYSVDRQQVVGGANLDQSQAALADAFVTRPEFVNRYSNASTAEAFVDAMLASVQQNSGVDLSANRSDLISKYNSGSSQAQSRSLVLQDVIENASFKQAEYNPSFVLMQYFGYLRRDPDKGGYDFWLNVLNNREPNNYRGMVCSFITSAEYQLRFASVVVHTNKECGQ